MLATTLKRAHELGVPTDELLDLDVEVAVTTRGAKIHLCVPAHSGTHTACGRATTGREPHKLGDVADSLCASCAHGANVAASEEAWIEFVSAAEAAEQMLATPTESGLNWHLGACRHLSRAATLPANNTAAVAVREYFTELCDRLERRLGEVRAQLVTETSPVGRPSAVEVPHLEQQFLVGVEAAVRATTNPITRDQITTQLPDLVAALTVVRDRVATIESLLERARNGEHVDVVVAATPAASNALGHGSRLADLDVDNDRVVVARLDVRYAAAYHFDATWITEPTQVEKLTNHRGLAHLWATLVSPTTATDAFDSACAALDV